METKELIDLLKHQAKEIESAGRYGWGNTMLCAASHLKKLEAQTDKGGQAEVRVSQAASQAVPEPNALSEFITVNETNIEVTPFEMLKLMVIAGSYEGKPTQDHWDKIEVWLNNLIKRVKSEA